mmetsp:Transcript_56690/g.159953  ORF Transcript_56690/g.159953 Transcript_56690/m.159953 type:complete len:525 (+) Transcript_56690:216-1790(+)
MRAAFGAPDDGEVRPRGAGAQVGRQGRWCRGPGPRGPRRSRSDGQVPGREGCSPGRRPGRRSGGRGVREGEGQPALPEGQVPGRLRGVSPGHPQARGGRRAEVRACQGPGASCRPLLQRGAGAAQMRRRRGCLLRGHGAGDGGEGLGDRAGQRQGAVPEGLRARGRPRLGPRARRLRAGAAARPGQRRRAERVAGPQGQDQGPLQGGAGPPAHRGGGVGQDRGQPPLPAGRVPGLQPGVPPRPGRVRGGPAGDPELGREGPPRRALLQLGAGAAEVRRHGGRHHGHGARHGGQGAGAGPRQRQGAVPPGVRQVQRRRLGACLRRLRGGPPAGARQRRGAAGAAARGPRGGRGGAGAQDDAGPEGELQRPRGGLRGEGEGAAPGALQQWGSSEHVGPRHGDCKHGEGCRESLVPQGAVPSLLRRIPEGLGRLQRRPGPHRPAPIGRRGAAARRRAPLQHRTRAAEVRRPGGGSLGAGRCPAVRPGVRQGALPESLRLRPRRRLGRRPRGPGGGAPARARQRRGAL